MHKDITIFIIRIQVYYILLRLFFLWLFRVRKTPPLCSCGRRSKRLVASKPGPNQGRSFFACSMGKSESNRRISGCGFFKWEDSDQGTNSKLSTTTAAAAAFTSNSSKNKVELQGTSSKSFSTYFANTVNAKLDHTKNRASVPAKLPLSKTVTSIISDKNVSVVPCQTVLPPPKITATTSVGSNVDSVPSTVDKTVKEKLLNSDPSKASVHKPTSLTNNVHNFNKTLAAAPLTVRPSVTSLSQETVTKVLGLKPTLGVARPSSVSDLRTLDLDNGPLTKRARLSFNAPTMSSGKGVHQGRVVQQYFGNVPLQQL